MDRLLSLLPQYGFQTSVFFSGSFCGSNQFLEQQQVGHLHVVRDGIVIMEHDGQQPLEIVEPSLVFYPRPFNHRLVVPPTSTASLLCATVKFSRVERNPVAAALPQVMLIPLKDLFALNATLNMLFEEASDEAIGKNLILDHLCGVLIVQLIRYAHARGCVSAGTLAGLSDQALGPTLIAIHANPGRPWRIEDMAAQSHMSRTTFANRFRDVIGVTPAEYLIEWRMALAEQYLESGRSVKEVALAVGYSSQPAFSKAFISRHAVAPSDWIERRQAQNQPL